jgi:hypothetical protein
LGYPAVGQRAFWRRISPQTGKNRLSHKSA